MTSETPTRSETAALDGALRGQAATIRYGTTRLARRMRSGRSAGALSTNKVSVLSHLRARGPATPSEIAAADRLQPQSLTRVFGELEQSGLVTRSAGADDRRQAILSLTDAGLAVLEQDLAERDAWLAEAIATLSETERGLLVLAAELMDRIADREP